MKRLTYPQFNGVKQHPVIVELARCVKRLRITWKLWRLTVGERYAATDLAYDRAYLKQREKNFAELLIDNAALRRSYCQQLQDIKEH